MIVVVAPYSPSGRSVPTNLGAARKIESVIRMLSEHGAEVVLVNTSHDSEAAPLSLVRNVVGGVSVLEVTPRTYNGRKLGKFRNLFGVPKVVDVVLELGQPELVWLYNGYAFESRFGRLIRKKAACPVILELEDWHFARSRGLNPKPFFDWFFCRLLLPHISYVFAVNEALALRMEKAGARVGLFPGVVADGIAALASQCPPFRMDNVTAGYFGGLSAEKGADQVADLVTTLTRGFRLVVTGSGELERRFQGLAQQFPDRLAFHGRVDDRRLLELIGSCDVLLNPHSSIESMANGIFPFKVIEGIASGRLLISTPLPASGLTSVLQGVHYIGHGVSELQRGVLAARSTYENTEKNVKSGASEAVLLFSKEAIQEIVNRVLLEAVK